MDFESGLDWISIGLTISRNEIKQRFLAGWSIRYPAGEHRVWVRPDGSTIPTEDLLDLLVA